MARTARERRRSNAHGEEGKDGGEEDSEEGQEEEIAFGKKPIANAAMG